MKENNDGKEVPAVRKIVYEKEIILDATVENIAVATDFLEKCLSETNCPKQVRVQMNIAMDELLGNIVRYAYGEADGQAVIRFELEKHPEAVCVIFIDRGIPYNPLEKKDPDIALPAKERKVGGLGIYIVRQFMDEMEYERNDGQNRLLIRKYTGKPA